MKFEVSQVYENGYGSKCEIIGITDNFVTYYIGKDYKSCCYESKSVENMLTFNGYVLK